MSNELWNQWEGCHDSADQQKRQASASKSACTPIEINFITHTGKFQGSSGNHTTSLVHCSCIDFNRRRLPCKHMYRLAMELGLMESDFASNTSDIPHPVKKQKLLDSISIIESLSDEAQILLKNILCNMNSSLPCKCVSRSSEISALLSSGLLVETDSPSVQLSFYKFTELKKRLCNLGLTCTIRKKQELIDWILENASDRISELCNDSVVVCASEFIKVRKVYMYLYRKYDFLAIFDGSDICDVPLLQTELPDDDVTFLLQRFGYYPSGD